MKDSDKTLAEFLGIEMPVEKPQELKVEKVYTDNLKEIVVELSNAELVKEQEKLTDVNNYKILGNKVLKATVVEDSIVLLLDSELVKNREYEVVVRNIDKAVNKTYKFKAEDNAIPGVEKVEVLGEYGIKVTATEPVKKPLERNFLIDGKNIAMEVEQYGRVIILTPYYSKEFPADAKTLTVKELVDFAGYKSKSEDFEIEIVKDEVAPKVTNVELKSGKVVEVTFDKDIYNDSVEAYWSHTSVGNISYKSGRHDVYSIDAEKVDVNKARYEFKEELPRNTEVTIEGVQNHSEVAMEATTELAKVVLDDSQPEVINQRVRVLANDNDGEGKVEITLFFDKNIVGYSNETKDGFDLGRHFALFEREVGRRTDVSGKIVSAKYAEDKDGNDILDRVVVIVDNLRFNTKANNFDYNYILEVTNFEDNLALRNRMYAYYVDFQVLPKSADFIVTNIVVTERAGAQRADTEIDILFSEPVDRRIAEEVTNYLFTAAGKKLDVADLKGEVIVHDNGYKVTLVLPEFNTANYTKLEILETLKSIYGKRLADVAVYEFRDDFDFLETEKEALQDAITAAEAMTGLTETQQTKLDKAVADAKKALDNSSADKLSLAKAKNALNKVVEEIEDEIAKSEEEQALTNAKTSAKGEIDAAAGAVDEQSETMKALVVEAKDKINAAKTEEDVKKEKVYYLAEIEGLKKAEELEAAKEALNTAIEEAEAAKVNVSEDGSDVPETEKWTTQDALTTFETAIAAAQAISENADATLDNINDAMETLEAAVRTYEEAQNAGTQS